MTMRRSFGVIDKCNAESGEAAVANFARLTLARKWARRTRATRRSTYLQKHLPEVEARAIRASSAKCTRCWANCCCASGDVASG